jgi:hypothetical protein
MSMPDLDPSLSRIVISVVFTVSVAGAASHDNPFPAARFLKHQVSFRF